MNSVPQLNMQYPNYGNVLAKGAAIEGQEARTSLTQSQNALAQKQIGDYDEDRDWVREKRGMEKQKMAWEEEDRAENKEIRLQKYKVSLANLKGMDLDNEKKLTEIISDMFAGVTDIKDYIPFKQYMSTEGGFKWPVDPEMFRDVSAFTNPDGTYNEDAFDKYRDSFVMEGKDRVAAVVAALKDKDPKPTYDHQTIYGPKGQTKRVAIKKGQGYIPPEGWSLTKPGKDTNKPEVKESTAIDKIVNIRKAIAKFDETGLIDAWIMKNEPDLAKTLNKAASPEDKEIALDAMRKQETYYIGFLSDANKKIFGNDNDPLGIR